MKLLLILLVLVITSGSHAQSSSSTQDGPIYDLTTTREDVKRLCTSCIQVSDEDTIIITSRFLGHSGRWTIIFDSTGRHRESNWTNDDWRSKVMLEDAMTKLTRLYGKPKHDEQGPIIKAVWHRGETAILLTKVGEETEVGVHWRFESDMPLVSIPSFGGTGDTDVKTGITTPR